MSKYVWMLAAIFSLFAEDEIPHCRGGTLETKAGYFFFTKSQMKNVYSNGGFSVQLSGSYPLLKQLQIYGSAGFREAWGSSSNFNESTTLWEIPIDLGLKPILNIRSWVDWYVALGPRYFYLHQSNYSPYVDRVVAKNGIGFFCNTGFNFFFPKSYFIDLFSEYSYEPVSISAHKSGVVGRDLQVSGLLFGAGFGRAF